MGTALVSRATPPIEREIRKGGLVTLRTMTCATCQNSGATNHLQDFEKCSVTSSNMTYMYE